MSTDALALPRRSSDAAFFAASALLFAASTAGTIWSCASMSAMGSMRMPGGWTMTMAWMRMPGQSWAGAAATFVGMWTVMMVAMMLPSLVPMLQRYRQAVGGAPHLDSLTAIVAGAYFLVWSLPGLAVFPLGAALAVVEMQHPALSRAVPIGAGAIALAAGAVQFSAWKSRHLACCSEMPRRTLPTNTATALRHGVRLGVHCIQCCASLLAVLLVVGVMDLRAMLLVTASLTAERLAPSGDRIARRIGVAIMVAGSLIMFGALAGHPAVV